MSLEAAFLFGPSVAVIIYLEIIGSGSFGHVNRYTDVMLAGSGVATAFPLLLFAHGARRVTLMTLGLLQYTAPTIQLLIGVFVYHESFDHNHLVGFVCIWIALGLYSVEGIWQIRRRKI